MFRCWARPSVLVLALTMLVAGCSPASDGPQANIQAAIDNPARGAESRARDAGRMPAPVLGFLGAASGMTVLDVGAGGGYYTEILSAVVGPKGKVIAHNTPSDYYENYVKATFEPLAERLANVEPRIGGLAEIALDDNSLDMVLIALVYHHMHYNPPDGEVLPGYTKQALGKVLAALKTGGVLGVIEHAAPDGTNRADSAALHRVDEATTATDFASLGFRLADKSRLLQVKTDDRTIYWYQTPHQGKTWRLLHKYIKP